MGCWIDGLVTAARHDAFRLAYGMILVLRMGVKN